MNIVEVQIAVENDGLGNILDNQLIKIDDIADVILAEKLEAIMELLKEANAYINEKVNELRDSYDDCDCY